MLGTSPWKTRSEWLSAHFFVRETEMFLFEVECSWTQLFCCHLVCYICFVVLYPHCVHWGVVWWPLLQIHSCDYVSPYLHRTDVFSCLTLGHCGVIDPLLLCCKFQQQFFWQVYPSVVVKRQAEEGENRAPHKLRAQRNLKLKTRARLNKRARKQKRNKALESNLRLSWIAK